MSLRVALVGCGAIARRAHLPAFRSIPDVEFVAFASNSRSSAEAARGEWGSGEVFDSWHDVVGCNDVDAVDVCAPNAFHAEIAIAAAKVGKHVLVEKPIARTLDEADAMVGAAEDAGVVLAGAHNVRYAPAFVAVRTELERGTIGEVVGVRAAFGHSGPEPWAPGATWFFEEKLSGGGALIDLGIHTADLLRSLHLEPVQASAVLLRKTRPVEDAAQVVLRFDGGAIGSMHISWSARPAPDHQLTIFGTDGTIHLDNAAKPVFRPAKGDARPLEIPTDVSNPYADFVEAIRTGNPPPVTGRDARQALAIIAAAYRSAETGCIEEVDR